ncbi:MAG: hypothetical protein A2Y62_19425 [Candidatus Fischerbacteria bacterium RBG_13_37_8]|uniref:Uncharacterized protein n=1 Tax=Candidatus Fischerbacteria bacterium RBG_13_37_8 TaxID=1817863 RepID=A0A1F5VP70_9BACT|nr:MAG: hypothetical protein A2Y62_19425 [Candidatus Fischerbacteria bacterium RBG_13_37_8]
MKKLKCGIPLLFLLLFCRYIHAIFILTLNLEPLSANPVRRKLCVLCGFIRKRDYENWAGI